MLNSTSWSFSTDEILKKETKSLSFLISVLQKKVCQLNLWFKMKLVVVDYYEGEIWDFQRILVNQAFLVYHDPNAKKREDFPSVDRCCSIEGESTETLMN